MSENSGSTRVLIVDDEALARQRLRSLLAEIEFDTCVVGEAATGIEAVRLAESLQPQVVLLDIRMPGLDGIEVARELTKFDKPPAVVFVTAFDEHALAAFETNAIDYLLKPIRRERLVSALQRAQILTKAQWDELRAASRESMQRTQIIVRIRGEIQLIPVPDIRYFRAEQKYVVVRTHTGESLLEESLSALESEFAESFMRVHRNALVSLAHCVGLKKDREGRVRVLLAGINESVEISRRHLPVVRQAVRGLTEK